MESKTPSAALKREKERKRRGRQVCGVKTKLVAERRAGLKKKKKTHLFVELDFAVQVLLCERSKILDFLRMVGFYLCHCRVQDGLASGSNFLVRLLRREIWMRTISKRKR
jgi:hypothetical protein